jgi:hypothetical protein
MDVALEVDQKVHLLYFPPIHRGVTVSATRLTTCIILQYRTSLSSGLGLTAGNSPVHLWSPQLDVRTQNHMELHP